MNAARANHDPGLLSGLLLQFVDQTNHYQEVILKVDPESSDVGYASHPEAAVRSLQLVVNRDARWQLNASLHQAHHGGELINGYATMFDTAAYRTESLQLLHDRKLILWAEKLYAKMFEAAIRLDARSAVGVASTVNFSGDA